MNPDPAIRSGARKGGWRRLRLTGIVLILLLVAGAVITVNAISRAKQAKALPALIEGQYWTVRRGPLVVSLQSAGQIKAKQVTEIKCMVHGDTKITWIAEEGTVVKSGDKVVELESQDVQEETVRQRIQVSQAKAIYEQAKQNLENQKSENYSDIIIAENKAKMADIDLQKYKNGDYQQKIWEADADIKLAEAELERARDRLDGTKKLLEKGYVNRGELQADTLAYTKCEIELDKSKNARTLLEKYEYLREISRLETEKQAAGEELKRTRISAQSSLANQQVSMDSAKAKLDLEEFQLTELEDQLKNAIIYAPQDGMVVYAQYEYDESQRIRAGGQIHYRQKIIDLPDFSRWKVEARVHESMIQQIQAGQRVAISIDAFQGIDLGGTVERISVLPDSSGRWYAPDTKEYLVDVDVTTTTVPLKPGMSARSEILIDSLKDVLYVPIQAINTIDGKATVYMRSETGPRPQLVVVGQSNDRFAEIKTGLRDGDQVMLSAASEGDPGRHQAEEEEGKKGEEKSDVKGKDGGKKTQDEKAKAPARKEAGNSPEAPKPAAREALSGAVATSQTLS